MNVVVYGARGRAGREIAAELLRRGHGVTAVTRTPGGAPEGARNVVDDASSAERIAEVVAGADAVVSALAPPPEDADQLIGMTERIVHGVEKAGEKSAGDADKRGPRLMVMGGAASLFVTGPDGRRVTLRESGYLPAEFYPIADAHIRVLANLRAEQRVDWTCLSPAAFVVEGPRRGSFRTGKDDLIAGPDGKSEISYADYAIAMVDELEDPQHRGERFSVGY